MVCDSGSDNNICRGHSAVSETTPHEIRTKNFRNWITTLTHTHRSQSRFFAFLRVDGRFNVCSDDVKVVALLECRLRSEDGKRERMSARWDRLTISRVVSKYSSQNRWVLVHRRLQPPPAGWIKQWYIWNRKESQQGSNYTAHWSLLIFFYVSAGQNRDQFPLEKSFSLSLSNIFHYFVSQFFLEPTKRQRFVLESTDIRLWQSVFINWRLTARWMPNKRWENVRERSRARRESRAVSRAELSRRCKSRKPSRNRRSMAETNSVLEDQIIWIIYDFSEFFIDNFP